MPNPEPHPPLQRRLGRQRARAVTAALAGGSIVGVAVLADLAAHTATSRSSATSGATTPAAATTPAGDSRFYGGDDDNSGGISFSPPGPASGPAPVRSGAS